MTKLEVDRTVSCTSRLDDIGLPSLSGSQRDLLSTSPGWHTLAAGLAILQLDFWWDRILLWGLLLDMKFTSRRLLNDRVFVCPYDRCLQATFNQDINSA